MLFDLEKIDDGDWFPFFASRVNAKGEVEYDEPKPGANSVRIRPIAPFWETRRATRKKRHEFALNPVTRAMERVAYFEELTPEQDKKENEDAYDYAITGVRDAAGEPIAFDRAAKVEHMAHPVFNRFFWRCQQMLGSARAQGQEDAGKNSSSGSAGLIPISPSAGPAA